MAYLLIKKIKYTGEGFHYESPTLSEGINIIEGPNGTGKSTFMNLIYYALSGDVPEFNSNNKRSGEHKEIVKDRDNRVQLLVEIEGKPYSLIRRIGGNEILVSEENGEESYLYPIFRRGNDKIFSDWLLEKLKIDVVEIFQGNAQYKINIKDLFRLVYHNQELDPGRIFKSPDVESYISESELLRKTIFQLLVGKTFSEYYKALAELKKLDKERGNAKSVLEEFTLVMKNLNMGREELNATFLQENLNEKIRQLDKLYQAREALKKNRPNSGESSFAAVSELKIKITEIEAKVEQKENKKRIQTNELLRFRKLRENIVLEVTQIKKIIHTHESLSLFSMDTCPYCLNNIDRKEHSCICGHPIDESEYQRFFYTSEEYMDILKSKQKTVKTVDIAIGSVEDDIRSLNDEIDALSNQYTSTKKQIRHRLSEIEAGLDIRKLDEIDDKILEVKNEMIVIERLIEQHKKLEDYQLKFDSLDSQYQRAQLKENELRAIAGSDMLDKVETFSKRYSNLMTKTLKNCNSAKIDSLNYMPIINNGEYREASSSVSKRLMYYLTLLSMSLRDEDVNFPRLLLIDTPKTAGIDDLEIDKLLGKISEELDDVRHLKHQVILTTGIETYPESFNNYVFQTLSDNNKLLIPRA